MSAVRSTNARTQRSPRAAAGKVKLPIKPRGEAKKLNRKGTAKVEAEVTYTPDGGEPNTQTRRVRLVKRD